MRMTRAQMRELSEIPHPRLSRIGDHRSHGAERTRLRGPRGGQDGLMTPQSEQAAKASLRTRIMVPMILLAGLALIAAGAIVAVIESRNVESSVDQRLMRIRDELRVLADKGVDPETGKPFAEPADLLQTFMERTVIGETEGEVVFTGDRVALVPEGVTALRLQDDPQLIEAVSPHAVGNEVVITSISTDQRRYRVLVAPVQFGTSQGALVYAYDMRAMMQPLRGTMLIYAVVACVLLALVALIAWPLVGRLLRPIEELRRAVDSIDELDLTTRVPVRGRDELAALTGTVNRMLDRVQRTVGDQRQLLDDVGHELRTPITVVRGHLELVDPSDPSDVVATRDLAIDEVDRMGVLINDLLVLAKAGQSDFVVPAWTDLAPLTDQTLEKARTLGNRRWRLESVAASEAWVDPMRITQAWLQLAANAVKYSDDGSVIGLGSRIHRGEAELWVRDQGIGIAADQLDHVRERFGRGREASSHAQGAGLGLSIVESILVAHGGRLDIQSTEGIGSTFTMVVPLAPANEPQPKEPEQ